MMTVDVKFHEPIVTKDGHQLGVAQRVYTNEDDTGLETATVEQHLKVFDFETGDVYFVPTRYLGKRNEDGVPLSINHQTLLNRSYSRLPRYIAYEVAAVTELSR